MTKIPGDTYGEHLERQARAVDNSSPLDSFFTAHERRARDRFELVKIALNQDLRFRGIHYKRDEVVTRIVALADAVLAEMDKDNEKGNT